MIFSLDSKSLSNYNPWEREKYAFITAYPSPTHLNMLMWGRGGLPWWLSGKQPACPRRRWGFDPWVRKIHWRRKRQPTLVFLPGKFHGVGALRALVHRVSKSWTRLTLARMHRDVVKVVHTGFAADSLALPLMRLRDFRQETIPNFSFSFHKMSALVSTLLLLLLSRFSRVRLCATP